MKKNLQYSRHDACLLFSRDVISESQSSSEISNYNHCGNDNPIMRNLILEK